MLVADINVQGGEQVAAQNPGNLKFKRMDVTQKSEWTAIVDLAFAEFGRLDIVVNNAGTSYRNKVRSFFLGLVSANPKLTPLTAYR